MQEYYSKACGCLKSIEVEDDSYKSPLLQLASDLMYREY